MSMADRPATDEAVPPRAAPDEPDPPSSSSGGGTTPGRLSFKERELLTALRRLANAQSQVKALEDKQAAAHRWDPADAARVEELEAELSKLRSKASSRFGGGAARERIPQAELEQRLVLDRLGFASYEEFRAADRKPPPEDQVDPVFLDFARRELAGAEEAYQQVLALPDMEAAEVTTADDGRDGDAGDGGDDEPPAIEVPDYPPPIDLT
jgi:hypothetical protein